MTSQIRRALCLLLPFLAVKAAATVPEVGTSAPDFVLADQHGKPRALSEWRGKWVVLYFYPKDDTPGCTEEACAFRDDMEQLTELQAQVVGISADSSASHKVFAEKYHLPFPLLADPGVEVAQRYGAVANWLVVKLAKRYTFLINPEGKIAKTYLAVETSRHSAEILRDLKRLKQATP